MLAKFGSCGLALAVLLMAGALGAADKEKSDEFDAAKLVGTWKYVSAVKDGEKMDEDRLKKQSVVIDKDTMTLKSEEATFVIKYELDAKKSPVTAKFTITKGPVAEGEKANGIIELKGDDLKICYAPMGGDAPTKFESKEGSKNFYFVLKRSK